MSTIGQTGAKGAARHRRLSPSAMILLAILFGAASLFPLRYQILRRFVPYPIEVLGYLLLGRPATSLEPVLFEPIELGLAQHGTEYTYSNRYRGSKIICLFFDNYDAKHAFAGDLIEGVDVEIWRGKNAVFSKSLSSKDFGDAYLLAHGRRALALVRISPEYAYIDEPLVLKIKINGWKKGIAELGRTYIGITNGSDY